MVQGGRFAIGAAAVALIHTHNVQARGHALAGNSHHVRRIAGTFQTVDDDDGERVLAVRLPVAMAQDPYSGLHFDHACFGCGQDDAPLQEEIGDGLAMAALEAASWLEL